MNKITVNSRKFWNQLINGDTFAVDTADFTTFWKANVIEKIKTETTFTAHTFVKASATVEIEFVTDNTNATFTHPFANWANEGFKIGDYVTIVRGVNSYQELITNIQANVLTTTDSSGGVLSPTLFITSGQSYPDLEFYNTTVPTAFNMQFGVVPNVPDPTAPTLSPNPYGSWLDGQPQAYYKSGIVVSTPATMVFSGTASAEISDSVVVEYTGVSSDGFGFDFTVTHIFRPEFYKSEYLNNLVNGTLPAGFQAPNSFRYIAQYKIATDATDANEKRIFTDSFLNGATGWIGNNFNAGQGIYSLESCTYDISGTSVDAPEVTQTTSVTIQISRSSGNFSAGQKAILYVSRIPSQAEYSNQSDTWGDIRAFDTLTQTDGTAAVDGVYIQDLIVDVNVDTTKIDITFDLTYDAAAQAVFSNGDYLFIGVLIGDASLSATASDRKVVDCAMVKVTKNSDITGLITDNVFGVYTSEKRPGFGLKTTNFDTWNNRLHIALVTFNLTKVSGSLDNNIVALDGQIVSRNSTTGESFLLDTFRIPFKAVNTVVSGTNYQYVTETGYRDFDIKSDAFANQYQVISGKPTSFDATHAWTVIWPFVIPWRTAIANNNVPGEFYDSSDPNNNLNYKTSNYSAVGDWDIYARLLVSVKSEGIVTQYALYSTECIVRDFDVDPDTFNWSATTVLKNPQGGTVQYLLENDDTTVEVTFSMATAGSLTFSRLVGEASIEEYNSAGSNWRLNSAVDWWYEQNVLKPIEGENYVKVTQDVGNNTITLKFLVDHTKINPAKSYTIMSHLQDTT